MSHKLDVLISAEEIQQRLDELAEEIKKDYEGKELTLICILKGGVMFLVDLARRLPPDSIELDFMDVSSYGDEFKSSGVIKVDKDLKNPITNKHVLLVEDIIDTGRTLSYLQKHLISQKPASLKFCTLLDKPERRVVKDIIPDYIGFTIPDKFVLGYGLDYLQKYRGLPYIGVMMQE